MKGKATAGSEKTQSRIKPAARSAVAPEICASHRGEDEDGSDEVEGRFVGSGLDVPLGDPKLDPDPDPNPEPLGDSVLTATSVLVQSTAALAEAVREV